MGMDFGDGPDFDAIKEERAAASGKEKTKKPISEDECWLHMYFIQKFTPTEEDDGLREVCKNTMTGLIKFRKRGKIRESKSARNNSIKYEWIWDDEVTATC